VKAQISDYTIVTYERKPDHWRAAIIMKGCIGIADRGNQVRSIIAPNDSATEGDANFAADQLIRRLRGR
jgi:hypothetical protein